MGKKETKNIERPQSAQELQLLQTQNQQLQKGIGVAEEQEARAQEQHQYWKDNYLSMEGGDYAGNSGSQNDINEMKKLDNQMPQYAEDTSGARGASQYMQPNKGGAKGTGGGQQGAGRQSASKGAR